MSKIPKTSEILRALEYLPDEEVVRIVIEGKSQLRERMANYLRNRHRSSSVRKGDRVVVARSPNLREDYYPGQEFLSGVVESTWLHDHGERRFIVCRVKITSPRAGDHKPVRLEVSQRDILSVARK